MQASHAFQKNWPYAWINALQRSSLSHGPNDSIEITAITTVDFKLLRKYQTDIRFAISSKRAKKGMYNPARWTLRIVDGEAEAVTEAQIVG